MSRLVTVDNVAALMRALDTLTKNNALVGVPAEKVGRKGDNEPINNAGLAYVHEHGVPELNIPARPFLAPGADAVKDKVVAIFRKGAADVLDGNEGAALKALNAAGVLGVSSVRNVLVNGEGFEPLADSTLAARARRGRKGAKEALQARREGREAEGETARPLFDTGQMARSITYVVRPKKGDSLADS